MVLPLEILIFSPVLDHKFFSVNTKEIHPSATKSSNTHYVD